MDIQNKRVVVAEAGNGMDKALSIAFKKTGAQSVISVNMNLKEADIVNVIEEASKLFGGRDIFCSNARIDLPSF